MARVVVTGGAGFLGSHLCTALLDRGDEVVAVDSYLTGSPANVAHLADRPGFTLVEADLIEGLPVDGRVDAILHFASPASPDGYMAHPIETLKVGSAGTHHVLERAHADGARVLVASTSEVYGDPLVHPQPETYWGNVNPIGPRSMYDEAKRYLEAATTAYRRTLGVDTVILRIFNVYGPRMDVEDGRVVSNFIVQALRGEPLTLHGDGSQTRSFCFVEDEVRGILALLDSGEPGPVNVGNDAEHTMRELAEVVLEVTGSSSPIVTVPPRAEDPRQRRPDLTLARTVLGWEPEVDLREGVARTVPWFRQVLGTA